MSAVSLDVEFLMSQPIKSVMALAERQKRFTQNAAKFRDVLQAKSDLFVALEELDIDIRYDFDGGSVDVVFCGDGDKLGKVWGLLRRAGYYTESRPKKGETGFNAFWDCPGYAKVWLQFSSTMCRRVQVGTKMVEQPVYEVQCGDLPEIDAPASDLVPL